jgi:hypothetical protein
VPLFTFSFHGLSIAESGVLKCATIIVCGTMCALSFSKVFIFYECWYPCIRSLDVQSREFFLVDFLISMKCSSLSFLINLDWKSILFDIRMATPACFLGPYAWIFFPAFYSEVASVFITEYVLHVAKCWVLSTLSSLLAYVFL